MRMNKDFICNDKYDNKIFDKVILMMDLPYWERIDQFMTKEYLKKWINYKKGILVNEHYNELGIS